MKNKLLSTLILLATTLAGCDRYETITCPFTTGLVLIFSAVQNDSSNLLIRIFEKNTGFQNTLFEDTLTLSTFYSANYGDTSYSYVNNPHVQPAELDFNHFYNYDWTFTYLPTMQTYQVDEVKPHFQHDENVVGATYSGSCLSNLETVRINQKIYKYVSNVVLYY